MAFETALEDFRKEIDKLSTLMDEVEALEQQKLAVLGFDQDNVLELEISHRFERHMQVVQESYALLVKKHPEEVANFTTTHTIAGEKEEESLRAFRCGEASLNHFWDLFGE